MGTENPRLYGTETNQDKFDYQDFKDDRVYTFFNLSANKNLSFTFKAKVAFSGNFFLPAVFMWPCTMVKSMHELHDRGLLNNSKVPFKGLDLCPYISRLLKEYSTLTILS